MARENIFKFEELLRTSEAARLRLRELADDFKGDKTDEEAYFAATIEKFAKEAGIPFSYEDGKMLTSSRELSDDELEAVAGGLFCYYIGGSTSAEAECSVAEGAACAIVGVTLY